MAPWLRVLMCSVGILGLTVPAACGSGPRDLDSGARSTDGEVADDDAAWASAAVGHDDQLFALLQNGDGLAQIPYYAEDVTIDRRSIGMAHYEGLDEVLRADPFFRLLDEGELTWSRSGPVFVDTTGSATKGTMVFDFPYQETIVEPVIVIRASIDAGKIESETIVDVAQQWRDESWRDKDIPTRAEELARAWVAAWSPGADDRGGFVYAPDATLEDSIGGLDLSGSSAIDARRAVASDVVWTLADSDGVGAAYPYSERLHLFSGAAFTVVGDDGGGCPGRQVVWLTVDDDGRVESERRFWAIEDARRCHSGPLPSGWWRDLPASGPTAPPYEDLQTVTGSIEVGGVAAEIRNGTPTLQSLTQWALSRFDRAGMAIPSVEAVTFTRFADYCADVRGRSFRQDTATGPSWRIVLCMDEEFVCRSPECAAFYLPARRAILHELAHVWTDEYLTEAVRDAFMSSMSLEVWNHESVPWNERAGEHAAEYIAWGLLDSPFPLFELGQPPIGERVDAFQLLTGHQPLQPSAAAG